MRCTRLVPESRKYVVVEGRVLYKYLEGTLTIYFILSHWPFYTSYQTRLYSAPMKHCMEYKFFLRCPSRWLARHPSITGTQLIIHALMDMARQSRTHVGGHQRNWNSRSRLVYGLVR